MLATTIINKEGNGELGSCLQDHFVGSLTIGGELGSTGLLK